MAEEDGYGFVMVGTENGVYKVTPPSAGITIRFVGKTGWYELTNDGKIVRWKDPK